MADDQENWDLRELFVKPFEHKVGPDLLDQAAFRKKALILLIDPGIADISRKDFMSVRVQAYVMAPWLHVLEVMELSKLGYMDWIEWLEKDPARDLRSDQLRQPGGAASGCACNQDASLDSAIWVDVQAAADQLDSPPE
jgi:hypothetical protein